MIKRKIRIINSPALAIVSVFTFLLLAAMFAFPLFDLFRDEFYKMIPLCIIWDGFMVAGIVTFFVCVPRRFFSIITIDETGVSRVLFGRFCKMHIPWDDMAEAFYFIAVAEFIAFSKDNKLSEMKLNKARTRKTTIEMTLSQRRYNVIMQYLQQPIVGMPYNVKARFEKYRQKSLSVEPESVDDLLNADIENSVTETITPPIESVPMRDIITPKEATKIDSPPSDKDTPQA